MTETQTFEIQKDIFQCSIFNKQYGITFNQFLLRGDSEDILVETGHHKTFESLKKAIEQVSSLEKIKHIIVPHFEADEMGALMDFMSYSPDLKVYATWMCCESLEDVLHIQNTIHVKDGEVITIDKFSCKFIHIPHVHQRDCMVMEEITTKTLFSADIFITWGPGQWIHEDDVSKQLERTILHHGYMPSLKHLTQAIEKFEHDELEMIAPMHWKSLKNNLNKYFRLFKSLPL